MRHTAVRLGDRLIKVGRARPVFVVRRMADCPDLPPHVQGASEAKGRRRQTVSVSALLDRRLYPSARNRLRRLRGPGAGDDVGKDTVPLVLQREIEGSLDAEPPDQALRQPPLVFVVPFHVAAPFRD